MLAAHAIPGDASLTATLRLASGTMIGPYRIAQLIGAGGMGEVYRARDTKLGRDVAIKVLPAAFTSDAERLVRFEREARVLAALNHPHIAAIYGFEDAGWHCARWSWSWSRVRRWPIASARGPVPLDEALPIARQIADALEAAHEQGHHPSRSEAGQHQGHARRRGQGARLRTGQGVRRGDRSGPDVSHSPTITVDGDTRRGHRRARRRT